MNDKAGFSDRANAMAPLGGRAAVGFRGRFLARYEDPTGAVLWRDVVNNVVPILARNAILDAAFGGAGWANVYLDLISDVLFASAPVETDTMGAHAGWKAVREGGNVALKPNYSVVTRPVLPLAPADGGAKRTVDDIRFDFVEDGAVKGFAISSDSTKGGTVGVLVAAGLFATGDHAVVAGGRLYVSYALATASV